jgi:peptidoglycan/LPS O-acetylase OafA/YrhL
MSNQKPLHITALAAVERDSSQDYIHSHTSWLDRRRPNGLNFLRLFFAVLVIISHAWHLKLMRDPLSSMPQATESFGSLAVNSFFIISGFLITASWFSGRGAESYLRSRILRIFPGFAVAFCLSGFLAALSAGAEWWQYVTSLPKSKLLPALLTLDGSVLNSPEAFKQNPLPNAVNGSLWTIPLEFNCYLAVAFVGALGLFRKRWLVAISVAACILHYTGQSLRNHETMYSWSRFAAMFGVGALVWLYSEKMPRSRWYALLSAAIILAALFLQRGLTLVWPIAGTYLIFYFAFCGPTFVSTIGRRNDVSYGVYLYAFPVQQLLNQLYPSLGPYSHIVVAVPLAIVFGWASWLLVERPAMLLK